MTGLKQAEKSDALIVRAFNCEAADARQGELMTDRALALTPVDLLERPMAGERQPAETRHAVSLKPYQIQTWALAGDTSK